AAAFAVTERLKLTKSPLMPGTKVSKVFSPTCSCARGRANIRIKLRRADVLTVTMLDARKQPVRTLIEGVDARRGLNLFHWDGHRILRTLAHQASGSVAWYGVANGSRLQAGTYTLEVGARDLAGNSTPVADRWRIHVRVRFIQLASHRIVAGAGSPFVIGVSTDAARYSWKLGRRKGR